jgi:hypothetical protein
MYSYSHRSVSNIYQISHLSVSIYTLQYCRSSCGQILPNLYIELFVFRASMIMSYNPHEHVYEWFDFEMYICEKNFLTTSGNKCWCNGGIKKCSFYVYLPWLNIDIKKYTKYKILKLLVDCLCLMTRNCFSCI